MKAARLAVPAAALLLFAGCSTPSGATAFSVDGNHVSNASVDDVAEGCSTLAKQPAQAIRGQIAQFLLYGELGQAIATRTHTTITPAMRDAALKQVDGTSLLADPRCARAANGLADFAAIAAKLGQQKLATQVKAVDVQVNPRYGTFDRSTATLSGTSGSLSREAMNAGSLTGN